ATASPPATSTRAASTSRSSPPPRRSSRVLPTMNPRGLVPTVVFLLAMAGCGGDDAQHDAGGGDDAMLVSDGGGEVDGDVGDGAADLAPACDGGAQCTKLGGACTGACDCCSGKCA